MTKRTTKQKTTIREFLISRRDHPTADVVYVNVKKSIPNISLGTVYRNLSAMAESGEILKLRFDDGLDHFDAHTAPHHHFICRDCGKVLDVFGVENEPRISDLDFEGEITGHYTYFYGSCPDCIKELKSVTNA